MRERIKRIVGESGMGDRFLRRTFSTFQLTDDNKRAAAAARRYAEGFDAMLPQPGRQEPGRNGLFIAGPQDTPRRSHRQPPDRTGQAGHLHDDDRPAGAHQAHLLRDRRQRE